MNNKKRVISISIRDLIEFSMSKGDLKVGFIGRSRARQGTKIHQEIQKSRPENYQSEVSLKQELEFAEVTILLQGRIDGIFQGEKPVIEEIKSTAKDLRILEENPNEMHLAQLKIYAYIYCLQNNLNEIITNLTYCTLKEKEILILENRFTFADLHTFTYEIVTQFAHLTSKVVKKQKERDVSLNLLDFPFEFRKFQKEMATEVFLSVKNRKNLFLNAPTGIGKTIGTIFPVLKAIPDLQPEKIFYLTARNTGKKAPLKALEILKKHNNDLHLSFIEITAKETICFLDEKNCDPEVCPYARDFFGKLRKALDYGIQFEDFSRLEIEKIAMKFELCPFELSLELSLFCDFVIMDYNYVFDPRASLQRYFDNPSSRFIFLIDEAHHLPERVQSMYSLNISKQNILENRRNLKTHKKLYIKLTELNKFLLNIKKSQLVQNQIMEKPDSEFIKLIRKLVNYLEGYLETLDKSPQFNLILDLYFDFLAFLKLESLFDENFKFYYSKKGKSEITANILCLNPAPQIIEKTKSVISKINFSATLYPVQYFKKLCGFSAKTDKFISFENPFPAQNQLILIDKTVKTTYKERDKYFEKIGNHIKKYIQHKSGNYLIFFPSFKFLNSVLESNDWSYFDLKIQNSNMEPEEREQFIKDFSIKSNNVGFVVMGGIFSEGIDLVGKRLIGAMIVGVGLPMLSYENNLIKEYFSEIKENGFAFAYQFPGFNKVLQSAGRVIRTSTDRGIIVLLDERFSFHYYRKIFPLHWSDYTVYENTKQIEQKIEKFWERG